jgi:hypothetical protein
MMHFSVVSGHPGETNGRLETRTEAPQSATTELLVAGVAQWVRFV